MLVDQLPFLSAPLKTVRFAHKHAFRITVLQYHVYFLYGTGDPHVPVYNNVRLENVHFAGFEIAEDFVKEF